MRETGKLFAEQEEKPGVALVKSSAKPSTRNTTAKSARSSAKRKSA